MSTIKVNNSSVKLDKNENLISDDSSTKTKNSPKISRSNKQQRLK
jgi:hypothetical protein